MVGIEQGPYDGALVCIYAGLVCALDLHEDRRPVPPECLAKPFERVHLIALDIDLEQGDGRQTVGGKKVVASHHLDRDGFGGGVVWKTVAKRSRALIGPRGWVKNASLIAIAECDGKDRCVANHCVVELTLHLLTHHGERLKSEH